MLINLRAQQRGTGFEEQEKQQEIVFIGINVYFKR